MNNKGMEIVVELIIILVFLAVVVFALINTHIFDQIVVNMLIFFCTVFALIRSALVKVVLVFLGLIMMYVTILSYISYTGRLGKAAETSKFAAKGYEEMVFKYLARHEAAPIGGAAFGIGTIITLYIISGVIAHIPLMCSTIDTHAGTIENRINATIFSDRIGSYIVSTWNMFGDGNSDPLYGLGKDPMITFVVTSYLKEETNMAEVYQLMDEKYGKSTSLFGDTPGFQLYCDMGNGFKDYGTDLSRWEDCKFKSAIVYILFFDKYPYYEYFITPPVFTSEYNSQMLGAVNPFSFKGDSIIMGVKKIE
jgi:hypothetical protein